MRLNRDMNRSYLMAGMGLRKIFVFLIYQYIEDILTPILVT